MPRETQKESDLLEYINHANALSAALNERTRLLHYEKQAARRLLSAFRFVSNCQLTRDATANALLFLIFSSAPLGSRIAKHITRGTDNEISYLFGLCCNSQQKDSNELL